MKKAVTALFVVGTIVTVLVVGMAAWHLRAATPPVRKEQKPCEAAQPMPPASSAPTPYLINEKDPPVEVHPEVTARLIDTLSIKTFSETVAIMLDVTKDQTTRNEAANLLHRSGYGGLTYDLIKSLGSPEEGPLWRSYCIQHLLTNAKGASDVELAKITDTIRCAIADRHTRVRREALLALCHLQEPLGRETAIKWLTAKEGEGARDVAIRCMEDLNLRDQAHAIRRLATDPDESTAVQAIGTLGRWKDEASRPLFEEALKSPSQRIQRAGRAAIRHLEEAKVKPAEATAPVGP